MTGLLDPQPLAEFYLVIYPDGRAKLVDTKLDAVKVDDADGQLKYIFSLAIEQFCAWMLRQGQTPNAVIGDGGATVVALRQRVYELRAEVERLKG